MIVLTRLNGVRFALNDELIETMSENPDTTISMTNKNIYIVQEKISEVIDEIIRFRKKINGGSVADRFRRLEDE